MIFVVRTQSSFIFSNGRSSGQEKNSALCNNETPNRGWENNVFHDPKLGSCLMH